MVDGVGAGVDVGVGDGRGVLTDGGMYKPLGICV